MNAVEIEEAVSALASARFDPSAFPFAFLIAFGVRDTTIARLRKGDTNASDVGGVLQRGNIHIGVAAPGGVNATLRALRESPKTASAKAKFILATDGDVLEAEDLVSGEPLACPYPEFADHFGFFLPLAGISTVKELKNNPIDVKATGRLNRLYVELLKEDEQWGTPERRHDLNQFMARLIFCFFAEDTGIFNGTNLFTSTIEQMSTTEAGSVEFVLTELFRAMDSQPKDRESAKLRPWADKFPWVNGGLFAGGKPCPKFSRVARSYLLRAGELNWKEINPDIFGSMIQAVADEGERGSLGMHYTSVPNIMKVLGPLFLDDLRAQLEAAGDNVRKLRNLRKRLASIRVFDPACGSGNFLVIAYMRMREIEHEIVKLTDDEPNSVVQLSNFYGIEIKDFASEIARLALLIAEFQCDVRFINQQVARSLVLPLKKTGQIQTDNALNIDWQHVCPATPKILDENASLINNDYSALEKDLQINKIETYVCGNPPYVGARKQNSKQKNDLSTVYNGNSEYKDADYVSGWFIKAIRYAEIVSASFAFVSTSSVCQGEQVGFIWPKAWKADCEIFFCHTPFKWSNNASNNAGVYVVIVGVRQKSGGKKHIYEGELRREVPNISPYLNSGVDVVVLPRNEPIYYEFGRMIMGNMARDDGNLILGPDERLSLISNNADIETYIRPLIGTTEIVKGTRRYCLWLDESSRPIWEKYGFIQNRVNLVKKFRLASKAKTTNGYARVPYRFAQRCHRDEASFVFPSVTPEERTFVTPDLIKGNTVVTNLAYIVYNHDLWMFSLTASQLHIAWSRAVSGRHGSGIRYTPTVSYHTFPVPDLSINQKIELRKCARNILLAREANYPASIDEMYAPEAMPKDLQEAHERNDEAVERIYIGRRFRNDTERLEKLFELYTKLIAAEEIVGTGKKPAGTKRARASMGGT